MDWTIFWSALIGTSLPATVVALLMLLFKHRTDKALEDHKVGLTAGLENLKAELSVESQHRSGLKQAETDALTGMFEAAVDIIDGQLTQDLGSFRMGPSGDFASYSQQTNAVFATAFKHYHRLFVYCAEHHGLHAAASNLVINLYRVHELFNKHYPEVLHSSLKLDVVFSGAREAPPSNEEMAAGLLAFDTQHRNFKMTLRPAIQKLRESYLDYVLQLREYLGLDDADEAMARAFRRIQGRHADGGFLSE